jgi:hypothetical protein
MEMPPDVVFHPSPRLFAWKPRGVLDETAVNKIIAFIGEQEAAANEPFLRFADLTALDLVELNFKYVFHVALYRRLTYAGHPSTKSAFLVTSPEATQFVKLHWMLTDHSPLHVSMFEDRAAAAEWLEVPPAMLEMP